MAQPLQERQVLGKQSSLGAGWKAGELWQKSTAGLCSSFNGKRKGWGTGALLEGEHSPQVEGLRPLETGASHLAPANDLSQLSKGGGNSVWRGRTCLAC